MEKIDVEICLGTTCFVLGGSQLQELEGSLDENMRTKVNIIPSNCLGLCHDKRYNKAPYVRVKGQVVENASLETVIEQIKRAINE